MKSCRIADRQIGYGHPCFLIAEAGVNHNGDLDMAHQLIDVAVEAGADAVKFQTFKAELVMTARAPKAAYQQETTDPGESQIAMVRTFELPFAAFRDLQAHCQRRGILFLSTPFDHESLDYLDALAVPAIKIPSGEITNLPLLRHAARTGKPIILSTGMSYLSEVDEAVRTLTEAGCDEIVLLHCVTNYPAAPEDANLRAMAAMATAFERPVGFSDHTSGTAVAAAAVALGACVIEKHFTLDNTLPGPDQQASLEPAELRALVRTVRTVESALGSAQKTLLPSEIAIRDIARRSIIAGTDIRQGTVLTEEMVVMKRPGTGLPAACLPILIGRTVLRDIGADTLLTWDMFLP